MKKLQLLIAIILLAAFAGCGQNSGDDEGGSPSGSDMKRYGVKQACIEYTVSGDMQSGTEVLYFDNWGAREAKYEMKTTNAGPMKMEENKVAFLEGAMMYNVNLKDNTGTKMENPMLKGFEGQDMTEVGEKMLKQMGGKKIGSERFLGKQCDIWEIKRMGTKSWVWQGVTLKTESNMMGMNINIVATKISENFDKSKLQRPKNIDYKDMGDIMKSLKRN